MRQLSITVSTAVAIGGFLASLALPSPSLGQPAEPDIIRIKTADGLNLFGKWFAGGKGQKSDTVILVHGYLSESSKWEPLAKTLQKDGYSVLMFDLRGHGKSTDFKVIDSAVDFTRQSYNAMAGYGLNPKTIKELKAARFRPAYYPYLVNDISAARKFVDERSDNKECNAGRIFIIGESNISPLVMLWIATEYERCGVGPAVRGASPKDYLAGRDIAGAVFLSFTPPTGGGTASAMQTAERVMRDKVLYSDVEYVGAQLKDKVAMAFVYGKEDKASATEASRWFTNYFKIAPGKKDDKEKVKYMVEVAGAAKLSGAKLLEISENKKDKDGQPVLDKEGAPIKESVVGNQILAFMKATKEKGINGTSNGPLRYVENYDLNPIPLDRWGLKLP